MKNILIVIFTALLFLGVAPNTQAQGFEKGKIYLDLGIGLPSHSGRTIYTGDKYRDYSYRTPSFAVAVRYGFNDFISGGLQAGYSHRGSVEFDNGFEEDDRKTYVPIGIQASFHVWSFLNNTLNLGLGVERLDLYTTLMTGAHLKYKLKVRKEGEKRTHSVNPYVGGMMGARYFFLDWMGAYVQFGYGMNSFVEGGLTFKF